MRAIWKGECILSGVAILLSSNFEYTIGTISKDNEANMISLDIDIGEISLKVLNLYAPNKDSPLFFEKVKSILEAKCIVKCTL